MKITFESIRNQEFFVNPYYRIQSLCRARGYFLNTNASKIQKIKGVHSGKKALLIGNGPSVSLSVLEKLPRNIITFCANRFHLCYKNTSFRPTYVVSGDRQMIKDFGQEMIDCNSPNIFLCDTEPPPFDSSRYTWIRNRSRYPFVFEDNIHFNVNPGGSTLIQACQIAKWMGITEMSLYGVDHNFSFQTTDSKDIFQTAVGDGNHFMPNYRSGKQWCPPSTKFIEESFVAVHLRLQRSGGRLSNSTAGGKLEVLERIPLEKFLG